MMAIFFSFYRNARANSLTPFRMGEGRNGPLGQTIYVVEARTGAVHSAGAFPQRRADTEYSVTFGLGSVVYRSRHPDIELELTLFVDAAKPVEYMQLKLRNLTGKDRFYRVVPFIEIVLAETAVEFRGCVRAMADHSGKALYFSNSRNDFVQCFAFVATNLKAEFAETSRARFFGDAARDPGLPFMVEHGHPDRGIADDGRKAAAFAGNVSVGAGAHELIIVAIGATESIEHAQHLAHAVSAESAADEALERLRRFWSETLSVLRIETNRPDVDRLVNDWLPYQLLCARLWGRTGPSQRSGAFGYRDQLQDVLPLIVLAPNLARKQILLHARQQFIEGDVLKWWHEAPQGGVGIGERTHASDPHLWLPYVMLRYVTASGDDAILNEVLPFIEGAPVPHGVEGHVISPLLSRDSAPLIEHCRRAVDFTLNHFGAHGLPLMGAGDWDDGMNLVGFKGRGESVWVGFFLYDILIRFTALLAERGDSAGAQSYASRAASLRGALDNCWREDRYVRAFADDGAELTPIGALSSAWPALSGAAEGDRGREAVENGLAALDKGDRVLLVSPPFDENSKPFPGRSADYPPGVRENGGQYSHGSSWFVDALARLGEDAQRVGDEAQAQKFFARAFEVWQSISPIPKTTPEKIDGYGLPPHQQPADVYDGFGYEGRGGWAWYSGAAARMISAAYAMLGVKLENGQLVLRSDAFVEKAGLQLLSVTYKGRKYWPRRKRKKNAPSWARSIACRELFHSSGRLKAPRSMPPPTRIWRFPAWLAAPTTPSFSMRSTSEAALL